MIHANLSKAALLLAATGLALLSGCSSTSSNTTASATRSRGGASSSGTPTKALAPSAAAAAATAECTEASLLIALPAKSTMVKYECAIASPTMWAAARVKPGPTVFFLQATSGAWKVSKADQVCASPSKRIPKAILAYCSKA